MLYNLIILGLWLVFILFWLFSSLNVKRDVVGGSWWYGFPVRVIITALFILVMQYPPVRRSVAASVADWHPSAHPIFGLIGTILCAAGIALAIWARVHLGQNWSPSPAIKEHHELVKSGPYSVVRHPIYTGMLLAMLGSCLVSGIFWAAVVLIVATVFITRIFKEEKLMSSAFPAEYPEYKKHTYALIPFVW